MRGNRVAVESCQGSGPSRHPAWWLLSRAVAMETSLEQFQAQLVESGLLSAEDITSATDGLSAPPQNAKDLARLLIEQKKLTKFQAQQIHQGKGKALVLGNYVILDKLGQGGMGMVLKARHQRMKRIVALKVLSPKVTRNAEAAKRFQREVEAAAKLDHPNIVTAHDADQANGTHFLVMQYIEGTDLSSLVKTQGPLPLPQALRCILQAARGLEFAHQQGVIHRDIKPANLLLDQAGTVRILDMGLARIDGETGPQAELTSTGAVMGTVDYMAPEQAQSTKNADARSDIYSLGITLWYLLVGRPAYDGDSLMARLLAHANNPIPSLRSSLPEIPESIPAIFEKMVAKNPVDRYQTMTDVLADLQSACTEQLGTALGSGEAGLATGLSAGGSTFGGTLNVSNAYPSAPTRTASRSEVDEESAASEATVVAGMTSGTMPSMEAKSSQRLHPHAAAHGSHSKKWIIGGIVAAALTMLGVAGVLFRSNAEEVSDVAETTLAASQSETQPEAPVPRTLALVDATPPVDQASISPVHSAAETNYALDFASEGARVFLPLLTEIASDDPRGPWTLELWADFQNLPDPGQCFLLICGRLHLKVLSKPEEIRWHLLVLDFPVPGRMRGIGIPWEDMRTLPGPTHLAVQRSKDHLQLFVNGVLIGEELVADELRLDDAPQHYLGDAQKPLLLDEYRVSNIARYAGSFTPQRRFEPDEHTVRLYHGDEGRGTVIRDSSGHAQHGNPRSLQWAVMKE